MNICNNIFIFKRYNYFRKQHCGIGYLEVYDFFF